jgi:hypothetical protein
MFDGYLVAGHALEIENGSAKRLQRGRFLKFSSRKVRSPPPPREG